ncbi:MAG: hypothetical protein ACFE9L_05250 [Candidatus Hodarchaeota archaeon]
MNPNPPLSVIGISFNLLYGVGRQHPTYSRGHLNKPKFSDSELKEKLNEAKEGSLETPAPRTFKQHFERIDYGGAYGRPGKFDYKLFPLNSTDWELQINLKWKMENGKDQSLSQQSLNEAFASAQATIPLVWGGYSLKAPGLTIPIKPQVLQVETDQFFTIHVFPDSASDADMLSNRYSLLEVSVTSDEVVNMSAFRFQMRKSLTFGKFNENSKAGRGPHEFGHMIGLPHDFDVVDSIMYFPNEGSPYRTDRWKFGDVFNKPFTSHFKMAKFWAEEVLSAHLNRSLDFIIDYPK